jgi:hypothetical protein
MFPTIQKNDLLRNVQTSPFMQKWLLEKYGHCPTPSPLLDPLIGHEAFRDFHAANDTLYSEGDYGADRRVMWAGFYGHDQDKYIHLGRDFNVPPGTRVCVDRLCKVVRIDTDYDDQNGKSEPQGWGRRVIVCLLHEGVYLLYAHLAPEVLCKEGDFLEPGAPIGHVGIPHYNGDWYAHLHVQTIKPQAWPTIDGLDGYCSPAEWRKMKVWCPDPAPYLTIP